METGIFLLLGTNIGDREQNLRLARDLIAHEAGPIVKRSSVYKTAPWGNTDQQEFYNQVIEIESQLLPHQLLDKILNIEARLGRIRTEKWGPRTIDIDILFISDKVVNTPELTVPHPGIAERKFTLKPLEEIAPDLIHPLMQKNISTLLNQCQDILPVEVVASPLSES